MNGISTAFRVLALVLALALVAVADGPRLAAGAGTAGATHAERGPSTVPVSALGGAATADPDESRAAGVIETRSATTTTESAPAADPAPMPARASTPATQLLAARTPTCAVSDFCYERLAIAGTIVPYGDCTGRTDVGTAIRSLECLSSPYLAAHAYTQFGRIVNWRAGDVVIVRGKSYVVVGAYTQQGCAPPARALAPLSMQTSLTSVMCGPILIVQARPE